MLWKDYCQIEFSVKCGFHCNVCGKKWYIYDGNKTRKFESSCLPFWRIIHYLNTTRWSSVMVFLHLNITKSSKCNFILLLYSILFGSKFVFVKVFVSNVQFSVCKFELFECRIIKNPYSDSQTNLLNLYLCRCKHFAFSGTDSSCLVFWAQEFLMDFLLGSHPIVHISPLAPLSSDNNKITYLLKVQWQISLMMHWI